MYNYIGGDVIFGVLGGRVSGIRLGRVSGIRLGRVSGMCATALGASNLRPELF